MTSTGRFTLPSEENFAEKTKELAELWGADAIRNSDGTHLDEAVLALGKKIYSAYFPTRAHNEWITLHMDETPQVYLLTARILAESNAVDVPLTVSSRNSSSLTVTPTLISTGKSWTAPRARSWTRPAGRSTRARTPCT